MNLFQQDFAIICLYLIGNTMKMFLNIYLKLQYFITLLKANESI